MKEKKQIMKIKNDSDRRLLSYVLDQEAIYRWTGKTRYSNFLNDRELTFLENYLKHMGVTYQVFRPSASCEKSIIYFGENKDLVSFYYIKNKALRHGDVLGSLCATGYTNSMLGDIFIQPDGVYFTNLVKYDPFLESSLTRIGKYQVTLEKVDSLPEVEQEYDDIRLVLTSLRFDLVIARLINRSRSQVLEFLKENKTFVNFKEVEKPIIKLQQGDIISVQHVGKFKVLEVEPLAKKGKVAIRLGQYK